MLDLKLCPSKQNYLRQLQIRQRFCLAWLLLRFVTVVGFEEVILRSAEHHPHEVGPAGAEIVARGPEELVVSSQLLGCRLPPQLCGDTCFTC